MRRRSVEELLCGGITRVQESPADAKVHRPPECATPARCGAMSMWFTAYPVRQTASTPREIELTNTAENIFEHARSTQSVHAPTVKLTLLSTLRMFVLECCFVSINLSAKIPPTFEHVHRSLDRFRGRSVASESGVNDGEAHAVEVTREGGGKG